MSEPGAHATKSLIPPAAARQPIHLRRISCEGFVREDGLFDIEGLLVDTKPMPLNLVTREVPAGTAIHQMRVRLTIDRERLIVDAHAETEHGPYPDCMRVGSAYRQLIGMRIEPGFTQSVKRLFRGISGCSHITELLPPMASTAFQMLWASGGFGGADPEGSSQRTSPLGGCHALRLDGPIVKTYFSHYQQDAST